MLEHSHHQQLQMAPRLYQVSCSKNFSGKLSYVKQHIEGYWWSWLCLDQIFYQILRESAAKEFLNWKFFFLWGNIYSGCPNQPLADHIYKNLAYKRTLTPPNIYIAIKKIYKKYSIKDNGPKTRIQEIAKLGLLCEYKISHFDFNPEGYDSEYITNLVQRIHNHC